MMSRIRGARSLQVRWAGLVSVCLLCLPGCAGRADGAGAPPSGGTSLLGGGGSDSTTLGGGGTSSSTPVVSGDSVSGSSSVGGAPTVGPSPGSPIPSGQACTQDLGQGGAATAPDPLPVTWTDPTAAADCGASPLATQPYATSAELQALLIGRWRRCISPQIPGEDVGVEFAADGKYYPLTFNEQHEVVRHPPGDGLDGGVVYGGTWAYLPVGCEDPISHQPSTRPLLELDGNLWTDAPTFTNDPRQMSVTLSPVLSRYVPLTAN